jgi:tetratricopeptide (TPR) repeat protein
MIFGRNSGFDVAQLSQDKILWSVSLHLIDAFERTDSGPVLVNARNAVTVAGFHMDRVECLDGRSTELDYAAAVAIYSTVLPSHPRLVPKEVRKPLGRLIAEDRDGRTGIAAALTKHAMVLVFVSQESGNKDLAKVAATVLGMGLDVMGDDVPHKPYLLSNLGALFQDLARDSLDDLDTAIEVLGEATRLLPDGDPYWLGISENLAKALMRRYEHAGNAADLDAVVLVRQKAVAQASARDRDQQATAQTALALAFRQRYEQSGAAADLDGAIEAAQAAVAADLAGSIDQAILMLMLGTVLKERFGRNGSPADLDAAIAAWSEAAQVIPADRPERPELLASLGGALSMRYSLTGDLPDLNMSNAFQDAILALAPSDPGRATVLSDLASALNYRYEQTGAEQDLESAIVTMRAAIEAAPVEDQQRPDYLSGLASMLLNQFVRSGDDGDLAEAIRLSEKAAAVMPLDHPLRPMALTRLRGALTMRFERTGSVADLDAALAAGRESLAEVPPDHPDYPLIQSNMGGTLRTGFERTGDIATLNAAIEAGRAAVAATSADDPGLASRLSNLGASLLRRFEVTGALADLMAGVDATREAVQLRGRAVALSNLSFGLRKLFERTGDPADIDGAVQAGREAVKKSLPTNPQYPMYLNNLAEALRCRHERNGDPADLDEAVSIGRSAVQSAAPGHPGRPQYLTGLSIRLWRRYELTGDPADLDAAVEAGRAAVDGTPADDPSQALYLNNLGAVLMSRYRLGRDVASAAAARDVLRAAAGMRAAAASTRAMAARSWGEAAAALADWPDALRAYSLAIEQLNLAAWHGLDRADRLHNLRQVRGLPAAAAAAALNSGQAEEAVVLLEQARGILLAQALQSRADRDAVSEADPQLAASMDEVRRQLDAGADTAVADSAGWAASQSAQLKVQRQLELSTKWDELVAAARLLPGLEDFLSRPSYDDLRRAGDDGPVVIINISEYRCDGLILIAGVLRLVPLPALTQRTVAERVVFLLDALEKAERSRHDYASADQVLSDTLAWLRQDLAAPILTALASHATEGGTASRLWWCPVGIAAFLPLHAVDLPGRIACSYTPSLSALLRARTRPRAAPGRMLAVALPSTPQLSDLPFAGRELDMVTRRMPAADILQGKDATRRRILAQLPGHSFLHFAGHGQQDPFSQASAALYTYDHVQHGPVTVVEIADLHLQDAELAFLSACETARGWADLPDESVHVAGAMQLAGFRHVIATQWPISDVLAPRIADQVYQQLTDPDGGLDASHASLALHAAISAVRDRGRSRLLWASYIHIGP